MISKDIDRDQRISEFISRHRLPDKFSGLILEHYMPLVSWLILNNRRGETTTLGINGAQGTGKSTLADFIRLELEADPGWRVAVLSLDDFYLTKAERQQLSETTHPLLMTRGVPGTHDLQMLAACLERLRHLDAGQEFSLPRFDKAHDDRADPETWPVVTGPIDLIILEGWCVGSQPQEAAALEDPVNGLERDRDASGDWRRYVNEQLAGPYAELFAQLDLLIFLQVPDFDAVYRWRLEQEEKLADKTTKDGVGIMNSRQVADFIQYFERITTFNLESLPTIADVTLQLDEAHDCVRSHYRQ